jgi:hypothetical protein
VSRLVGSEMCIRDSIITYYNVIQGDKYVDRSSYKITEIRNFLHNCAISNIKWERGSQDSEELFNLINGIFIINYFTGDCKMEKGDITDSDTEKYFVEVSPKDEADYYNIIPKSSREIPSVTYENTTNYTTNYTVEGHIEDNKKTTIVITDKVEKKYIKYINIDMFIIFINRNTGNFFNPRNTKSYTITQKIGNLKLRSIIIHTVEDNTGHYKCLLYDGNNEWFESEDLRSIEDPAKLTLYKYNEEYNKTYVQQNCAILIYYNI